MKFLINKALNLTLIFLILVSTLGSFPGIVSASSPPTSPPTHLSPPNGATGVSLTPTFSWGAVSGATRYGLYIRDTVTGVLVFDSEARGISLTGTSYTLPSGILVEERLYRWNMRAGNAAGWGPFSTAWTFTTGTILRAPTVAPSHISPANDTRDVSLTPTFSWGAVSGATHYGLYIRDTVTGVLVFDSEARGISLTGTSYTLPSGILVEERLYRWNMRAGNAAGWGPFSTAWTFTTGTILRAPTVAPSHISPANDARDVSLTPTFSWGAVSGATHYGLYIRDTVTGVLVFDSEARGISLTGTSYTLPSGILVEERLYRWNMRAGNAAGWGPFSTAWTFTTRGPVVTPPTTPPIHISPPDGATNVSLTPTFSWNPVSGATRYGLYIRDTVTGVLVFDSEARGISLTGTSYTLPSGILVEGRLYRWNMRAGNAAGWGPFSTAWTFTTRGPVVTPPTTPPIHISPPDGATNVSLTPTFSWNPVSGATRYGLYIRDTVTGVLRLSENTFFDAFLENFVRKKSGGVLKN
jgi:hypothetical protein